ncbi:MAG: glycosyl hydrolase family 8 [Acuticoccus sp.]
MAAVNVRRVVSVVGGVLCWVGVTLGTATPTHAAPQTDVHKASSVSLPTTIEPHEWAAFVARYVDTGGRVVDIEKNGTSHSEGQAYGMLLAVKAGDRALFDRILAFTFKNMRRRRDSLMSWAYDPRVAQPITDRNNASDGDIIIAYALLGAATKWNEPRYAALARPMIADIGRLLLSDRDEMVLLRPAAFGFDQATHSDGPVINLSYYVYGALLAFAEVDERYPFFRAWQSGLMLTERAVTVSNGYAPDWITMRSDRAAQPAHGFAKKSSYDAVRIPLYMMLGGQVPTRYLAPFDRAWNIAGNRAPADFDLATGRKLMDMRDSGYRTIAALTACAVRGEPIPGALQTFRPSTYFSSALHLLALSAARTHYPHCVGPTRRHAPTIAVRTAPSNDVPTTAPRAAFGVGTLVRRTSASAQPLAASESFFRMR